MEKENTQKKREKWIKDHQMDNKNLQFICLLYCHKSNQS